MPPKRTAKSRKSAKKTRKTDHSVDKEPTAAWNRSGAKALIDGDGFDSQIFTLIVGSEEKQFTVHVSYLAQSPVFDRMCHGHFEESHTLQIRLPEDDPKVMKAVIQYLYSGSFSNFGTEEACGNSADAANELAEIYSVAEKYGLQDLKTPIVEKLRKITNVTLKAGEFLSVAMKIYACTPDTDGPYRTFFKETAATMEPRSDLRKPDIEVLNEYISSGGSLAVDLVTAACDQYTINLARIEAEVIDERERVYELKRELAEMTRKMQRYKDRWRFNLGLPSVSQFATG
ncbi:MAG: hypothetical protein Q9224_005436 [Gallowayella concinna]